MPTQRKPLGPDGIIVTQVTCTPHPAQGLPRWPGPTAHSADALFGPCFPGRRPRRVGGTLLRSSVGPRQRPSLEEGEGTGERGPEAQSCFKQPQVGVGVWSPDFPLRAPRRPPRNQNGVNTASKHPIFAGSPGIVMHCSVDWGGG